eukprot:s1111_g25.t2
MAIQQPAAERSCRRVVVVLFRSLCAFILSLPWWGWAKPSGFTLASATKTLDQSCLFKKTCYTPSFVDSPLAPGWCLAEVSPAPDLPLDETFETQIDAQGFDGGLMGFDYGPSMETSTFDGGGYLVSEPMDSDAMTYQTYGGASYDGGRWTASIPYEGPGYGEAHSYGSYDAYESNYPAQGYDSYGYMQERGWSEPSWNDSAPFAGDEMPLREVSQPSQRTWVFSQEDKESSGAAPLFNLLILGLQRAMKSQGHQLEPEEWRANTSNGGEQLDEPWRAKKFNDQQQLEDELWRHGASDVHVKFLEEQSAFLPPMNPRCVASVVQRISADLVSLKNWQQDLPLLDSCVLQAVAIWRTLRRQRAERDPEAIQLLEAFDRGSLALAATALQLTGHRARGDVSVRWNEAPVPRCGWTVDPRRQGVQRVLRALRSGIEPSVEEFLQIFAKRWSSLRQDGLTTPLVSGAMCSAQLSLLSGYSMPGDATPRRLAQVHFMVSCHFLGQDLTTASACCAYDKTLEEDFKQALRILLPDAGNLTAKIALAERVKHHALCAKFAAPSVPVSFGLQLDPDWSGVGFQGKARRHLERGANGELMELDDSLKIQYKMGRNEATEVGAFRHCQPDVRKVPQAAHIKFQTCKLCRLWSTATYNLWEARV